MVETPWIIPSRPIMPLSMDSRSCIVAAIEIGRETGREERGRSRLRRFAHSFWKIGHRKGQRSK